MKKVLTIIIPVLLIALGTAGILIWYFMPINRINRAFEEEDYQQVVELFDSLKKDKEIYEVQDKLESIVINYYNDYISEDITFDEAKEYTDLVTKHVLSNSKIALQYVENLEIVSNSRDNYDKAIRYMDDKNYIDAIKQFENVSSLDKKYYKIANEKASECKQIYIENVLKIADNYIDDKEYESARNIIDEAINYFPNDNMLISKKDEIKQYFEVNIYGTWISKYDFGRMIAGELGVNSSSIKFELNLILEISENKIKAYVDKTSIKPALDILTSDEEAMNAIYHMAESYGIKKKEADFLVNMMYGGSYADFILDNFGNNIDAALSEYSIDEDCTVDISNIYIGKQEETDEYISYTESGEQLKLNEYKGNNSCLNLIQYPLLLEKK